MTTEHRLTTHRLAYRPPHQSDGCTRIRRHKLCLTPVDPPSPPAHVHGPNGTIRWLDDDTDPDLEAA